MKRVSLSDVARAAGVGKATASRALSGREDVGAATRERIRDIATSMGYHPHRGAQGLRTGRFDTIALVMDLDRADAGDVLRAAAVACDALGYQLLVAGGAPETLTDRMAGLSVDGWLLVGSRDPGDVLLRAVVSVPSGAGSADVPAAVRELVSRIEEAETPSAGSSGRASPSGAAPLA